MLTNLRHQETKRRCCFKENKVQKQRGRETWPRLQGTRAPSSLSLTHPWALPNHWCFHCSCSLNQLYPIKESVKGARAWWRQLEVEGWQGTASSWMAAHSLCLQRTAPFSAWWSNHGVAYTGSLFCGLWGIYYCVLRKSVWLGKSSSSLAGCPSQMMNFLQMLLLCCLVCSLCWLTGWISLFWGSGVVVWVGRCVHRDGWCNPQLQAWRRHLEAGERCCTTLRLLGATCFRGHRPSSSWGLFPLWSLLTGYR